MQVYNGVDLVRIERIGRALERQGQTFLDKWLSAEEQLYCGAKAECLAGRFAAKEAVVKALGSGFWQNGVRLLDIEILPDKLGAPQVRLEGAALRRYEALGGRSLALSISHEGDLALAFCTLLAGTAGE